MQVAGHWQAAAAWHGGGRGSMGRCLCHCTCACGALYGRHGAGRVQQQAYQAWDWQGAAPGIPVCLWCAR